MSKKIIGITVGTPINPDKFGGGGGSVEIAQEPGGSETAVMSQKAVTTVLGQFSQTMNSFQTNINNANNELTTAKTNINALWSFVNIHENTIMNINTEIRNINTEIGNIDSVLDAIIARQNSYIGGEA